MSSKKEIADDFYTANVRCEKMIPVYMCLADTLSPSLANAIEEPSVCALLGLPADVKNEDEITEILQRNNKVGFLAQFATPTPFDFSSNGSVYTSGWGWYQTKWFYANDIDGLEGLATDWAHKYFEQCKKKENGYDQMV